LLVLITPHVVQDQRDARALTDDLRNQLINAGLVPQHLQERRPAGLIAVGMPITEHPPHRTGRAAFPHPAPTLD